MPLLREPENANGINKDIESSYSGVLKDEVHIPKQLHVNKVDG